MESKSLESFFGTNHNLEKDGIDLVIHEIGATFKLRRFGGSNSTRMNQTMMKRYKPVANLIEKNLLPEDARQDVENRVFAECCLAGWSGVKLKGKELPFSIDNAIKLFSALPDLKDFLYKHANDPANFKDEDSDSGDKVEVGN